jgi:hypothetical protein
MDLDEYRATVMRLVLKDHSSGFTLPECRQRMRSVSAGLIADRYQNLSSPLHALDLSLHDPQFRRIHLVVGRVDGHECCFVLRNQRLH